jgi:hypothetical protein
MRKAFILLFVILATIPNCLFAQNDDNDDMPYLSENDIESIEAILPEDIPEKPEQFNQPNEANETAEVIQNEIDRLNTSATLYHLLILDRSFCTPNEDINGISEANILYKFKHLKNGYLILLYKVPESGPVFPIFPQKSYIILDLMSNRINP